MTTSGLGVACALALVGSAGCRSSTATSSDAGPRMAPYSGGITINASSLPMPTRDVTSAWASFQLGAETSLVSANALNLTAILDMFPFIPLEFPSNSSLGSCVGPVGQDLTASLNVGTIVVRDGSASLVDLTFDGGAYDSTLTEGAWDAGDSLSVDAAGAAPDNGLDGFSTTLTAPPHSLNILGTFGGIQIVSVAEPLTIKWTPDSQSVFAMVFDFRTSTAIVCLVPSAGGELTVPPPTMAGFQANDLGSISLYPVSSSVQTLGEATITVTAEGFDADEMLSFEP